MLILFCLKKIENYYQARNFATKYFQIISGLAAINQKPKEREKIVDNRQQQQQHSHLRQNRKNFLTQSRG